MLQFELRIFCENTPLPSCFPIAYCSMTEVPQHQTQQQPVPVWAIDSIEVVVSDTFEVPSVVSISSDDESSLVSSVSSSEDDGYGRDDSGRVWTLPVSIQQERKRVLFGGYWNANRGESGNHSKATDGADSFVYHAHEAGHNSSRAGERHGNERERISISDAPTCQERRGSRAHGRRKIFHFTATVDTLPPVSWSPNTGKLLLSLESVVSVRATSMSDSCSHSQPSSCLRRSRFAPGFNPRELSTGSNMSEASVSFHPVVEIVTYEIPMERWACEGWMQYFA
jgi:hypothetical protein